MVDPREGNVGQSEHQGMDEMVRPDWGGRYEEVDDNVDRISGVGVEINRVNRPTGWKTKPQIIIKQRQFNSPLQVTIIPQNVA